MNDQKSMELNVAEQSLHAALYREGELKRELLEVKQIARDLCETISYLAPDLLDRWGYTFEKKAVMRFFEVLNEDPDAHFRDATKEAAK